MSRRKLRQQRPEAFWGALIGAGASLLSSFIGGKSQADNARAEADAIIQASKENARALEEQNKNNNLLQQQSQKFIADQNAEARQFQKDLQTSMQLQAGQLSTDERRTANRIVVKKGGKVTSRKKLRDIPFYGGGNLGFHVTDGGGVLPLGQTPEGYDLYEIIGNDHDHYHKTRNGKYKSGVGIKFDNGQIVEGEGNQNGNQGEYLMVTPDSGMFISKHSINGFNPAQAINEGMNPSEAYAMQEASKGTSPVRRNRHKATAGILVNDVLPLNYPIYDVNNMTRRQLRKGGRCKAWWGLSFGADGPIYGPTPDYVYPAFYNHRVSPISVGSGVNFPKVNNNTGNSKWSVANIDMNLGNLQLPEDKNNRRFNISGNILGAGITGLGNFLGAGLTNIFTNKAAKIGAAGALEAGRIQANALRNLQTVDMSMLDGENGRLMFSRGHYMPATESTREYNNYQLENISRTGRRAQDAYATGSASSAARLSRMAGLNSNIQEMISRVEDARANKEAENRRANMAAINEAGANNLQLDIEALRDRTAARLDLLKHNNDIVNRRIAEPAQIEAEALANAAEIRSAAKNAIGQSWANATVATGKGFGNAVSTDYTQNRQLQIERSGGAFIDQVQNVSLYGSESDKAQYRAVLQNILSNPNLTAAQRSQYNMLYGMLG